MSPTLRPDDRRTRLESEGNWKIRLTSYKLGDKYVCIADNVDPGAVLSRAEGVTRDEAESAALKEAREAVRRTRIVG